MRKLYFISNRNQVVIRCYENVSTELKKKSKIKKL